MQCHKIKNHISAGKTCYPKPRLFYFKRKIIAVVDSESDMMWFRPWPFMVALNVP